MTFLSKIGYGLGIFGPMLGWVAAMQYLMYFYTEVVGLAPGEAGLIFVIGLAWDAISDPLIGAIADRTRSRWGRYRPYLLFGALPYGLAMALLFTPPGGSPPTIFLAALGAHLLFRTGYTLVYMPYTAMIARMTTDYDSRTDLTAFKTFFVFCANLTVSFAFYTLVMQFGDGDERDGFQPAAALIGLIAALTAWLCFAYTREREIPAGSALPTDGRGAVRAIASDLIANRPFLMVFFGVAIFGGFYGAQLSMIPYVAKYWFGDPAAARTLFTVQAVLSLASIPGWLAIGHRFGKKTVWIAGTTLAAAGLIAIFVSASKSVWFTAVLYGIANIGATGFILIFYAMTADTVDWGRVAHRTPPGGRRFRCHLVCEQIRWRRRHGIARHVAGLGRIRIGRDAESGNADGYPDHCAGNTRNRLRGECRYHVAVSALKTKTRRDTRCASSRMRGR